MRLGVLAGLVLAAAIGLGALVSPFASSAPDGLNRVAIDQGFAGAGTPHAVQEQSPIPGYAVPGVHDERGAKALAGLAGTLTVFVVGAGLAAGVSRKRPTPS